MKEGSKLVAGTLTEEKHKRFQELARKKNKTPHALLTEILEEYLSTDSDKHRLAVAEMVENITNTLNNTYQEAIVKQQMELEFLNRKYDYVLEKNRNIFEKPTAYDERIYKAINQLKNTKTVTQWYKKQQ